MGVHLVTGLLSTNAFPTIVMLVFTVSGWSQVLQDGCLVFTVICREWEFTVIHSQGLKLPQFLYHWFGCGTYKTSGKRNCLCFMLLKLRQATNPGDRTQSCIPKSTTLLYLSHISQFVTFSDHCQHGLWPQNSAAVLKAPCEKSSWVRPWQG